MVTNSATNTPTGASGTVLQGQGVGTANAFSTATYPATTTINQVLYSNAANTVTGLATANSAVLATNGSGVPSITATPTITSVTFGSGTALSNYLESTFTPGIAFGGGTTGIKYGTQSGTYVRIGRVIYVSVLVTLTNKGSSTGSATITGFPVAVGVTSQIMWARADLVSYPAGDSVVFAVANSGTSFSLFGTGSNNNPSALADTNFNNTSSINMNGFYFV